MKIIQITSLGCMSCIVMDERIESICKKNKIELEIINSDLEDISNYEPIDLFPLLILYNTKNQELSRFEGEYSKDVLEEKILGCFNA